MYNNEKDAAKVASKTNKIIFENDVVRVMKFEILPGEKEPLHTHPYKSVTIVEEPALLRYYDKDGNKISETVIQGVSWVEPTDLHSAENVDKRPFKGYRFELKQ